MTFSILRPQTHPVGDLWRAAQPSAIENDDAGTDFIREALDNSRASDLTRLRA